MDRNIERFLDFAPTKEIYLDRFKYCFTGKEIEFLSFSTNVEVELFFGGKLFVTTISYSSDGIDTQGKAFDTETVTLAEILAWIKEVAE